MDQQIPEIRISRGLQGIYADRTETTYIDGKEGTLEYRGYSIHDLAENSTFEEVAYLLLYGSLPNKTQLSELDQQLKAARGLPSPILDIIAQIKAAHPMDVLRTAVSALSAYDPDSGDKSPEATYRVGIRLTSQVSEIIMAHHNIVAGRDPIAPNREISHAANFLYMMNGKMPSERARGLMDKDFVLHADHGLNASAFTARVVTSTGANIHSAVTAGIGALSGPLHGGAAENVAQMAEEIGQPENAAAYVKNLLENRQRVMGFGHRVYKAEDPRARHLAEGVRELSRESGKSEWYEILEEVRNAMSPYSKRGIHVNVDFYAGVMYQLLGIPKELYVPIFAAGRIPGWTIQIVEQSLHNILIRPLLMYSGPRERKYIPIDERD